MRNAEGIGSLDAAAAQRARQWVGWVFPAILALLATPLMSGLITAYHVGPAPDFLERWLGAWLVSTPAALFVVYVVSPAARRVTERLVGMMVASGARAAGVPGGDHGA